MEVKGFEPPQEEVIPIRKSERTHRAPTRLCLNVEAEEHSLGDLNEPTSYKAAMFDSESNKWIDAMNAEIQSMIDNMVWVLVDLPPNCKTVGIMSKSEPGEMAPESSRAVVLPKFEMHIHTSILTAQELKEAIIEYCIPTDLHPRPPPPGLTMNRLSPRYIGIYMEQLEQGGLRIPFSTFFLVVIKHFRVHVSQLVPMGVNRNKTGGHEKKCFKELTSSLKGWKKKFFLIDRRAIPDAMPWRHIDTDLRDEFPTNYNEDDAALGRVCHSSSSSSSSFVICVRIDYSLSKSRAILRKLIPEKSSAQRNLEKPNSKIAAAGKRRKNKTLLKQRPSMPRREDLSLQGRRGYTGIKSLMPEPQTAEVEKDVVDLSEGTRLPTPQTNVIHPSTHTNHGGTQDNVVFSDAHSFHSAHNEDTGEDAAAHRFVSG
ncbi:hypothetical protein Tco_0168510 [Tanacetum coccineum]